ncbi:hypothetical protein ALP36_03648 [Pseudomonas syringae pv. coriandricola]|uniref:Uncharacterized protein n=1 Tax=Pseudomonas syringae pv. coriandricola TaxID=264453 RepID=A0A3M4TQF2_9PSED|nr:hypothetical protein [Pseudomonas syringae group genomosp. 3]RMR29456.1 hypothetical protein ALP87_02896 [Pseudomonas syringae pv. coriandricola]RMU12791.1 hypothetical protein ALP36_03648 [Pseudomonas syringae pv. coriandricola]
MSKTNFTAEAQQFKDEMLKLVEQYEDGVEPDERYTQFTNEFSKRIIAETVLNLDLENFNDARLALRIIAEIEAYDGDFFEGNVDSYLDVAIRHIMKPPHSLRFIIENGESEKNSMVVNGVELTIAEAIRIFEHIEAVGASLSHTLFYNQALSIEDIASENLGYNPIQKPKEY